MVSKLDQVVKRYTATAVDVDVCHGWYKGLCGFLDYGIDNGFIGVDRVCDPLSVQLFLGF